MVYYVTFLSLRFKIYWCHAIFLSIDALVRRYISFVLRFILFWFCEFCLFSWDMAIVVVNPMAAVMVVVTAALVIELWSVAVVKG